MKNSLVRASVVVLAILQTAQASSNSKVILASVPVCWPTDPTYCGLH